MGLSGRPGRARFKKSVLSLLVIVTLLAPFAGLNVPAATAQPAQPTEPNQGQPLPPPGEVIVVLKPGAREGQAAQVAASVNVRPQRVYTTIFEGFAANVPAQALRGLVRNPNVAFIQENLPVTVAAQTVPTGVRRVEAASNPAAAIDGVDNPIDADIAVIDTGIDLDHPDLNVVGGVDCVASDDSSGKTNFYDDDGGHGTHVAGIAAARDNGTGVVGVAPSARLWAVKVLDAGNGGSFANVLCGLDWVAARGGTIDVANMSLTATVTTQGTCSNTNGDSLHLAICETVAAGVSVFAAAGNSDIDAANIVPAKYAEVIAVSAVTDYDGRAGGVSTATSCSGGDDTLASYSNYGAVVDIAAPGSCISSTLPGGYGGMSGTSMAAPHAAGAAALYRSRNPGASPSAVRSWLLGSAAQPQNSSVGFTGDTDGSVEPFLYLSDTIPNEEFPPGDAEPSFSGTKLSIAASSGSLHANSPSRVYDGATSTSWETTSTTPYSAYFMLDLGSTKTLSGLKWLFRQTGGADEMLIQTSLDGSSWRTVGRYGNPPTGGWWGEDLARDGRYVRFTFLNPNGDAALGYVAEVEVWGRAGVTYPPGDPNPSFTGAKQKVVASSGSSNASNPVNVYDNNTSTSWETTSTTPRSGTFTLDLGGSKRLTGVKWVYRLSGNADEVLIQTSLDNSSWRTVGRYGNAPAGSWYGEDLARDGRYIRFTFYNPNKDAVLGYIAEVQVWGGVTYPPGDANPSFSGSRLTIARSSGTSNANSPSRVHDGSTSTSWETTASTPSSAAFTLDLGQNRRLTGVKWLFRVTGGADEMLVQTSVDGSSWRTVGRYGSAPAGKWYGEDLARDGRYVRFTFRNPNKDAVLGYVAEVQVWGTSLSASSASLPATTDTATATAVVTPLPTLTATETVTSAPTERTGVVAGTGGDGVRCRAAPSADAEILAVVPDGATLSVTGEEQGGWVPVRCGNQAGFVRAEFLVIDGVAPTVTEPTTEPTFEPTEAPLATPYPIVAAGDSEQSGTAHLVADGDPRSFWLVSPSASPDEARLVLDLGAVHPVDRIEWEVPFRAPMGIFEIWLSADGQTWWSLGRFDGQSLNPSEVYQIAAGVETRYVAFVLPDVGGQSQVGGLSEVRIWPAETAAPLTDLGPPVAPTPPADSLDPAALPTDPSATSPGQAMPTETPNGNAAAPTEVPSESSTEESDG